MSSIIKQIEQFALLHDFMTLVPSSTDLDVDKSSSFLFLHAGTTQDAVDVLAILGNGDWEPVDGNLRSAKPRLGFPHVTIIVGQQREERKIAPELLAAIA